MTDNSLPIADKKPLQKRYYATFVIFIALIIRILENRFTNRILHKKSNRKNRLLFYFTYALLLQLPHLGDTHNLVRRGQFFVAVGDNQQFVAQ